MGGQSPTPEAKISLRTMSACSALMVATRPSEQPGPKNTGGLWVKLSGEQIITPVRVTPLFDASGVGENALRVIQIALIIPALRYRD